MQVQILLYAGYKEAISKTIEIRTIFRFRSIPPITHIARTKKIKKIKIKIKNKQEKQKKQNKWKNKQLENTKTGKRSICMLMAALSPPP